MATPVKFAADVKAWSEKAKRNVDLVVKGSAQDVFELMSRRIQGLSVGGTFQEGFVPVGKTSGLINSLGYALNAEPQPGASFEGVIAGFDEGDTIVGGFSISYARHVEYGTSKMPGRFFIRNAVQQWEVIVDQNAAQFRDAP